MLLLTWRNTMRKGVTRSLMPWTYPEAGCLKEWYYWWLEWFRIINIVQMASWIYLYGPSGGLIDLVLRLSKGAGKRYWHSAHSTKQSDRTIFFIIESEAPDGPDVEDALNHLLHAPLLEQPHQRRHPGNIDGDLSEMESRWTSNN